MGYDAKLGGRIRSILGPRKGLSEKEMFGGLAFLRDGKMFVGIIKDELMARVGKDAHEEWERKKGARTMDFTHRPMKGYLQVRPQGFHPILHGRLSVQQTDRMGRRPPGGHCWVPPVQSGEVAPCST